MPRSSKHGHGRLVLTNTRRPWHGSTWVRVRGPDDCTPVDCLRLCGRRPTTACSRGRRTVRSCAVVRSAFSETAFKYQTQRLTANKYFALYFINFFIRLLSVSIVIHFRHNDNTQIRVVVKSGTERNGTERRSGTKRLRSWFHQKWMNSGMEPFHTGF